MNPHTRSWVVSVCLGVLIGWTSRRTIYIALEDLWKTIVETTPDLASRAANSPVSNLIDLPLVILPIQLAVAVIAAFALRRSRNMLRRLGWGLLATGGTILLGHLLQLFHIGFFDTLQDVGPGFREAMVMDFLLLHLARPSILISIGLIPVAAFLLRKGARAT